MARPAKKWPVPRAGKKTGIQTRSAAKSVDIGNGLFNDSVAVEEIQKYRVDRWQFIIYVGGDPETESDPGVEPGVEHRMADRFVMNLRILSGIDPQRPILVVVFTCGGNWDEGMQIASAIAICPNPVTVLSMKWSRSMSSIFPLAADRFFLAPFTKYMFHRGSYSTDGTDQEAETNEEERKKAIILMHRIYAERLQSQGMHAGKSLEEIEAILQELEHRKIDVWLDTDEAVEWGFADGVYTGDESTLRMEKVHRERRAQFIRTLRTRVILPEVRPIFKYPGE